jgi:hypothetical protein
MSFSSCFFCKPVLTRPIAKTSKPEARTSNNRELHALVVAFHFVIIRYIRMYQSSRVNLNPRVGLWVKPLSTPHFVLASAHVITLLSAVRSYPNNYVSSHEKACHCRAPYICLVRIRICCRRVTGRSPFASCAHLEATVVQEKHRCCNYYNCIQHCGRHPSSLPPHSFGGHM